MNIPLITSYTEFQQRLGYCKLLLAISKRAASQPEQMLRQLDGILFKPTSDDKDTYLGQILRKPVQGKPAHSHLQTRASLTKADSATSLRSFGNEAREIFALSRALGLVDERVVILENAMPLVRLIPDSSWELVRTGSEPQVYNPLDLDGTTGKVSEKTFFLLRLLTSDIAFTLLPLALNLQKGATFHRYIDWDGRTTDDFPPNMLTEIYERLICKAKPRLFGEVRNAKELDTYFLGDHRKRRTNPGVQQYARFRHQATPRLEFHTQLGIIAHEAASYTYAITDTTEAYVEYVQRNLVNSGLSTEDFVGKHTFKLAHTIYKQPARDHEGPEEVFSYFLKAYALLEREIGNTPASSICTLGCLLAQNEGVLIEIAEMHQTGREHARKYSEFLRYSGGSSQVGDYLISVDSRLLRQFGVQNN